jgi:hypothetical protein
VEAIERSAGSNSRSRLLGFEEADKPAIERGVYRGRHCVQGSAKHDRAAA